MLVAPNGDIFVTEMRGGRVTGFTSTPDGTRSAGKDMYLQGLKLPLGLTFYPDAQNSQWLYVAESYRVTRYAYQVGDVKPRGETQIVVAQLPSGGRTSTRDIAFSPDGERLFVSVGTGSNVAEICRKRPREIACWEAAQGLRAAWDAETHRAAVLEFDAQAPAAASVYGTGIRNCVSFTVQPGSGALLCTTNDAAMPWVMIWYPTSTRVPRTAASTAGHGTTWAPTKIGA